MGIGKLEGRKGGEGGNIDGKNFFINCDIKKQYIKIIFYMIQNSLNFLSCHK